MTVYILIDLKGYIFFESYQVATSTSLPSLPSSLHIFSMFDSFFVLQKSLDLNKNISTKP